MAIELFSENSGIAMSPRISFSYDLSQTDIVPVEQQQHNFRSNSSSSNIDFDFCVLESFQLEFSSADELFSDGKILPVQIKSKTVLPRPPPAPPPQPPQSHEDRPDIVANSKNEGHNSKSFWRFNRSSSLNLNLNLNCYTRTLCSLPILSRSNSTGSSPKVTKSTFTEDNQNHKQNLQKYSSISSIKQSQSSSSCSYLKPPLKKSYGPYYGNGVRNNKVLNFPSANLFDFCFSFTNGKEKIKRFV